MKLFIILSIATGLQVSAKPSDAQYVTISGKNISIVKVFKEIRQQTNYQFFYKTEFIRSAKPVDLNVRNVPVRKVLDQCFKDQPLTYAMVGTTIVVKKKVHQNIVQSLPAVLPPIKGTVRDSASGHALVGVTIQVKGSTLGTVTDAHGQFSLSTSEDAILVVSYLGYDKKEIALNGRSTVTVLLSSSTTGLDQVVVVGYGTQKKKDLTGSIASINSSDIKNLSVTRVDQALLGKVAGVQVKPVSGAPGAAPQIRIRGIGSISAGGDPLYVIDGFPTSNIETLNPDDIASMDILKDASATAIYGSRGSNGVIIINTKRGNSGKPTISLDAYYGFQEVSRTPHYMNAKEQAEWAYYAVKNRNLDLGNDISGPETSWDFPMPQTVLDVLSGKNKTDVDAVRAVMQRAPEKQIQLRVSGGSENFQYSLSGEYLNQEGIIVNTGFDRYSVRANFDSKLTNRLHISMNINPTFTRQWGPNPNGTGYGTSILGNAASINPYNPLLDENGDYFIFRGLPEVGDFPNPLALANEIITNQPQMRIIGNININYNILDKLSLKILLGGDLSSSRNMQFVPQLPSLLNTVAEGQDMTSMDYNWLTEYTLNYENNFGKHHITGLAGFTVQKEKDQTNSLSSDKFPNNLVPTLSATGGLITAGSSDIDEWSLVSYLARVNYDYNSKYYITASIRTDGSSRFGEEHKYGIFPSAAIAWRLSEENFLKDVSFLSELKLRLSYGETGNDNIGNYEHLATINNVNYPLSNSPVAGYTVDRLPNPSLTWEKQKSLNEGIDASFFGGRLGFTADYFQSRNTDLLLNVNIPDITGFNTSLENIGEVKNTGWEFVVHSVNLNKNFEWTTDINLSTYRNKVVKLGPKGDPIINSYNITEIGKPIGMFYGLLTDGYFKTQKELDAGPIYAPGSALGSHLGDIRFKDLSGPDGKPDGKIDSYDRTIIGSPYPNFYYGMTNRFTYKNLSLSISLQGLQGNKVFSQAKQVSLRSEFRVNQLALENNFWKSEDDPGDSPRPNDEPTGGIREISQRYLDAGSYLRINNISLSYMIPTRISEKLRLRSLRIYLNSSNPFVITKNVGFNPDVSDSDNALTPGLDNNDYPLAKSYRIGINVTF